jgi:hypothetical protein
MSAAVTLFKIVTIRDEIVIGLPPEDLAKIGGSDAAAVGETLARNGQFSAWRYAVRKAENGELEQAPLHRISILGHDSLRVEPYSTPLPIAPIRL